MLSRTSFGSLYCDLCTKFVILDIKYRFTSGDSNLSEIIKTYQNTMTKTVLKLFFALYSSNDDSNFWKKFQFWRKFVSSFS